MNTLLRKADMVKQHQAIDSSTKIVVIKAVESGNRRKIDITKSFGLPKSTVSTIKHRLCELYSCSNFAPGRKCLYLAAHSDLEEALFSLFSQARSMNVLISGPILKVKSKDWL